MNKNKFNKDKIIIPSILIVFVLLIIISIDVDNRSKNNQSIVKDFVMFVEKVVMYPFNLFDKNKDIKKKIIKN